MKTTKQLYDVDPTQFAYMLYPDVLDLKEKAAKARHDTACIEKFQLPLDKSSIERDAELNTVINEATKALGYIKLWKEELANFDDLLEQARTLCISAHYGQFRRGPDKLPYHTHPMAVADMMETPIEKIVALLHDVVEDTGITIEEIEAEFGSLIAKYVGVMTHIDGVPYSKYIEGIKKFDITTKVKIGDITHNSMSGPSAGSKIKYQAAIAVLIK